jgi:3-polyprenyl-4-hydroxybenzoate decarboxylase
VPELMLASLIAGQRCRRSTGSAAPADRVAEFALIGEVPPRVRRPEGPFGDHYGYYSLQHDYPVFECSDRASRGRDLSRDGRGQAAAGGLLHRRPAAGAALAAVPLVMSRPCRAALVVRARPGYHSLCCCQSSSSATQREAMASAFESSAMGQLSLTKFLLGTGSLPSI